MFAVCNDTQIKCKNGFCKPRFWSCDGVNDCGDNTDEENCGKKGTHCQGPVREQCNKQTFKNGFFWFCPQGSVKLHILPVETGNASMHRRSAMATMTVVMAQMSLNVKNVSAFIY